MTFRTDSILPDPPDGAASILHDREYRVRAFRVASDRLLIQGAMRDQKPPGLYLDHDPDPLTVHHMQVSLSISFPELEIVDVIVHMETHPNETCPSIAAHYGNLVGLSIARGFTHRIRELFGGPRGCTHTTALLQAMAPVAVQCFWSMHNVEAKLAGEPSPLLRRDPNRDDQLWRRNINTCHVFDEHGPTVAAYEAGESMSPPLFIRRRLAELGEPTPD